MRIAWICGLPNEVRLKGCGRELSPVPTAAWSWILGHLPPPTGVELHILCPVMGLEAERVDFDYLGVKWHCVRQDNYEMFFFWRRVLKKMRPIVNEIKPDVIHGWGGETGCGYLATRLTRHACVSIQGLLLLLYAALMPEEHAARKGLKWCAKRVFQELIDISSYKSARMRFCESHLAKDALAKYYGGLDSLVIPHPLRKEFLEPSLKRGGLESTNVQCLFVGALLDRKGAMDAVKAFRAADVAGAKFVMIGSGPLKDQILSYARQEGKCGQVEILDQCTPDQIVAQMKKSQFFLLPTYADTGPTALKEALSQGLYPICYDNSGPKELVGRYCGRLVPTAGVAALESAIRDLSMRVGTCIQEGGKASQVIRQDLAPKTVWRQLLVAYREALHEI